ncbi:MAG: helix-turn-helix transcriptional regulator [Nitriliruptoraceae bacterium]
MWLTVEELEALVGGQVRQRRRERDLTLAQVAEQAGVTRKTVQNLELGHGSTLATLVKVLRVLGAEQWLETLTPPEPVSPIAMRDEQRRRARRRASGAGRG